MSHQKNRRILIVDDNAAIHDDFSKIIGLASGRDSAVGQAAASLFGDAAPAAVESLGYELVSAFQGHEALACVQESLHAGRPFALAFVDVRMPPGWDGVETVRRVWEVDPELQVVVCTAYSDYSWNDMIRVVGETDRLLILKKPFDNVEVRQMASALTEKWQLARDARRTTEQLQRLVDDRTKCLTQANQQLTAEIAEHARSAQALRNSESRIRGILDTTPDGVVTIDEGGRVIEFNRTAEKSFGLPAREVIGHLLEKFIKSPEFWAEFQSGLAHCRATGSGIAWGKSIELTVQRAEGPSILAEASLTVLPGDGQPIFIAFLRDLTARKKLEAQLAHSQRLEAVGALAGGVAHEFNNLLQAIQGYTRFAMEGLLPDDQRYQDLDRSLQMSKRAAILTRELLGFSRRQVLERAYVSPNQIVRDLAKMLRSLMGEHIEIHVDLKGDVGTIHVDSAILQQMLLNLCINARDAMPAGGTLAIGTQNIVFDEAYCEIHPDTKPGRYLILSVADTGCGMSHETQQHLFEPFYTTKEVGQGTGLGLALVYGGVQQHGGTIQVDSELCVGTTFRLYLPTVDHAPDVPEPASPDGPAAAGGRETILIAEDEPLICDLLVRILSGAGYHVLTAAGGEEAIFVFEANSPQIVLVLLDLVMPKMDGRAVYQRIKMLNPSVKVIFCSGYDPDDDRDGFITEEGLRLVQKPFHPAVLLKTVREALDAAQRCLAS
jgi:PAS domain S-box-containing protein